MTAKASPQVGIRALREAYGLSIRDLMERIEEHGVVVKDDSTIRHIEIGRRRPSKPLLNAWAKALGLNPLDVTVPIQTQSKPEADAEPLQDVA